MTEVERAEALRELAALLRAGLCFRAALQAWPDRMRGSDDLVRCGRLAALGAPLERALAAAGPALGGDLRFVQQAVAVHRCIGGDPAQTLEAIAAAVDRRALFGRSARAQAAGARLSARLIALLPVATVPLVPGSVAMLLEPLGFASMVVGGVLVAAGLAWIERLLPIPPEEGHDALLAAVVCGGLRSGAELPQVLVVLARLPEADRELAEAGRRAALGMPWSDALQRCDGAGLAALGASIRTAERLGVPVADAIWSTFETRRAGAERAFEERARSAPVRMVVPLTICVLPAFVLLGLVPFLLQLSP